MKVNEAAIFSIHRNEHVTVAWLAPSSMNPDLEKLREAGFRITAPRRAMIDALREARAPVTVEELHKVLNADADLVTVYRSIEALEKVGIARRSYRNNGVVTFAYALGRPREFAVTSRSTATRETLPVEVGTELAEALASVEQTLAARGYRDVISIAEFFAT